MRVERPGELAHGREAEAVLAALKAGDDGMARPHPLGQLLLREAELHALADHQPGELLVGLLLFEGSLVGGALASPLCQRTPGPNSKTTPPGVINSLIYLSSDGVRFLDPSAPRRIQMPRKYPAEVRRHFASPPSLPDDAADHAHSHGGCVWSAASKGLSPTPQAKWRRTADLDPCLEVCL